MKNFSISDIESLTGIKAHTIRIWEQRYGLFSAKRSETNIRFYDDEDLRFFLNISVLNQSGYKISKISKMDQDEIVGLVKNLQSNHQDTDTQIKTLLNATIKMDDVVFEEALNHCTNDLGLEKAIVKIIFPFLNKIGEMWQVGSLNVAHEHFASHKIQQKIIEATYKTNVKTNKNSKKYILFLPPQEQHEIGLLFAQYLLRKNGQHYLYLGQNLPFETLQEAVNYYKPDFAFTALTTSLAYPNLKDTLSILQDIFNDTPLLVTGKQILAQTHNLNKNLYLIENVNSFIDFLAKKS